MKCLQIIEILLFGCCIWKIVLFQKNFKSVFGLKKILNNSFNSWTNSSNLFKKKKKKTSNLFEEKDSWTVPLISQNWKRPTRKKINEKGKYEWMDSINKYEDVEGKWVKMAESECVILPG